MHWDQKKRNKWVLSKKKLEKIIWKTSSECAENFPVDFSCFQMNLWDPKNSTFQFTTPLPRTLCGCEFISAYFVSKQRIKILNKFQQFFEGFGFLFLGSRYPPKKIKKYQIQLLNCPLVQATASRGWTCSRSWCSLSTFTVNRLATEERWCAAAPVLQDAIRVFANRRKTVIEIGTQKIIFYFIFGQFIADPSNPLALRSHAAFYLETSSK